MIANFFRVSIHALLAECDKFCCCKTPGLTVSIHALLAECDIAVVKNVFQRHGFNPRTPCGVRLSTGRGISPGRRFQSTHSLRSATRPSKRKPPPLRFQSTHSLRSATRYSVKLFSSKGGFNPRTPCGVRRQNRLRRDVYAGFNPRTPCGVRHCPLLTSGVLKEFQSTHSLRSATMKVQAKIIAESVSIHALLAECDIPWV